MTSCKREQIVTITSHLCIVLLIPLNVLIRMRLVLQRIVLNATAQCNARMHSIKPILMCQRNIFNEWVV